MIREVSKNVMYQKPLDSILYAYITPSAFTPQRFFTLPTEKEKNLSFNLQNCMKTQNSYNKLLLRSFHLNSHSLRFHRQAQKLDPAQLYNRLNSARGEYPV